MKVILKADIKGVGKKNEVINASDGYVRNFLFPKNLAVEANAENMSKLKAKKQSEQYKKDVCNDMIANSEDEEEIKKARIELSIINDIEDICEERSRY